MGTVKTDSGEYYSINWPTDIRQDTSYEVEYESRQWQGKTYKTIKNYQVKSNGAGGESSPENGGYKPAGQFDDRRSQRIERQSARRDAIAFHALECAAGLNPTVDRVKELTAIFEAML